MTDQDPRNDQRPEPSAPAVGSQLRAKIEWYQCHCREYYKVDVSELAVRLALAAESRGNGSDYECRAANAMRFETILANT